MPEEEPYLEYPGYKQNTRENRNMSEFELTTCSLPFPLHFLTLVVVTVIC